MKLDHICWEDPNNNTTNKLTVICSAMSVYHSLHCIVNSKIQIHCIVRLFDGVQRHFQQYFSYIVAVSFIGGGNRRIRRKTPTCRKSLTNFIT